MQKETWNDKERQEKIRRDRGNQREKETERGKNRQTATGKAVKEKPGETGRNRKRQ